jgi:hypothetical protein
MRKISTGRLRKAFLRKPEPIKIGKANGRRKWSDVEKNKRQKLAGIRIEKFRLAI